MTASSPSLALGAILVGKFRITREVGRGGMASVYEAENIDIGKRVAVKLLSEDLAKSAVVTERFIREARASARVKSPHICEVYDVGTYEGRPFIVMELLEGESLYERLVRERILPPKVVLEIANDIAAGLAKAHEARIVHRDLKPENIFLQHNDGGRPSAKILDFGLAKYYEPTQGEDEVRLTKHGALFGTPAYMSPEQARGGDDVDHRSDLWALGCMVYEMLTGKTVWDIKQGVAMIFAQVASSPLPVPSQVNPRLTKRFDEWFRSALNRRIDCRFQDAMQLASALALSLGDDDSLKGGVMSVDTDPRLGPGSPSSADPNEWQRVAFISTAPPGPAQPSGQAAGRPESEAVNFRKRRGRTFWLALALVAVASAAAGIWQVAPEQVPLVKKWRKPQPAEREPYAVNIGRAQELLASGQGEAALRQFEAVFREDRERKAARSFVAHAEAGLKSDPGPCRLTGLGHPRPFDMAVASSQPTLALGDEGLISGWVDNHEQRARRQAYTVLLDSELRRVSELRNVTPDATSVRNQRLISAGGGKVGLLYWDARGPQPGVFTRLLDETGAARSPAVLVSAAAEDQYFPALTRDEDGEHYWLVYSQRSAPQRRDLMLQRLDSGLIPHGPAIRLTALAPTKPEVAATRATVASKTGKLFVAFALDRKGRREIVLLRAHASSPALQAGGVKESPSSDGDEENDRFLDQALTLGTGKPTAASPHLVCTHRGCLVAWDGEDGARLAFVEHSSNRPAWEHHLPPLSTRPSVAARGDELVAAWFFGKRVYFAMLKDGRPPAAKAFAKMSGSRYDPHPEINAGSFPGRWLVSWRDFEAGKQEPFVAQLDCHQEAP